MLNVYLTMIDGVYDNDGEEYGKEDERMGDNDMDVHNDNFSDDLHLSPRFTPPRQLIPHQQSSQPTAHAGQQDSRLFNPQVRPPLSYANQQHSRFSAQSSQLRSSAPGPVSTTWASVLPEMRAPQPHAPQPQDTQQS